MAITQYLQNESTFGPDDIKVMSRALEDACKALNIDGDVRARETSRHPHHRTCAPRGARPD